MTKSFLYILSALITILIGGWTAFGVILHKYNELESLKKLKQANDYIAEGRTDYAENFIKNVLQKEPYNVPFLSLESSIYWTRGDYRKALANLKRIRDLEPNNVITIFQLAVAYQAAGELDAAEECFKEYIERDPDNYHALTILAGFLRGRGKYEEAIKVSKRILQIRKIADSTDWLFLADTYLSLGDCEKAIEEAKKVDSGHPGALGIMGTAYMGLGKFTEAEACFEATLQKDPENQDAREQATLCRFYQAPDNPQNLIELLRLLEEKSKKYPRVVFFKALLELLLRGR